MPELTLVIKYSKNLDAVITPSELKTIFFPGIALVDQYGNPIPDEVISFFIEAAQKEIADTLSVKLKPTIISENRDFHYDDWIQWGYMNTTYPVVKPLKLQGFLNTSLQIDYPISWLSAKKQSPDEDLYHRSINLVPVTGGAVAISSQPFYLQTPFQSIFGSKIIPNYWHQMYQTGFNKIPADILRCIGLKASIDLFINQSDIALGSPGIASKSIGIDGLSQSVGTTASSGKLLFGARIDAYKREMQDAWPKLKSRYAGITFHAF